MAEPGDLHAAAEELLAAAIDSLDTIPTFDPTLAGAPDRAFVSFGSPVLDCCPQLTVDVAQVLTAPTQSGLALGKQTAGKINHVYLVVTSVRCVPGPDNKGKPPSAAEMQESARQLNADGWSLWNHLYTLWTTDRLFSLCGEVFWDAMRTLGPQGNCAGWVLGVHISLSGYNEVASS